MGVGVAAIWYVDAEDPAAALRSAGSSDSSKASSLARTLFPGLEPELVGTAPISSFATAAEPGRVLIGTFDGVTVVCASEPAVVKPSTLEDKWVRAVDSRRTFLLGAESTYAWGAFAEWDGGSLRRSFSASLTYIHENVGLPGPWELPFWSGEHPIQFPEGATPDPQALPFHPQQFADLAATHSLGLRLVGTPQDDEIDPSTVLLFDFMMRDPSAPAPVVPAVEEVQRTEDAEQPTKKRFGLFRRS